MTKVTAEQYGDICRVRAKGHATGSEQVCAAISGILYAFAGWLENAKGRDASVLQCKMNGGDVEISAIGGDELKSCYEMTVIGLLQLEKSFPEYISVTAKKI